MEENVKINSEYISTIDRDGVTRLIAVEDFTIDSDRETIQVCKGTVGGIVSQSTIIGKSWITLNSVVKRSNIKDSCITGASCVEDCVLNDSCIVGSFCYTSTLDHVSITSSSTIKESFITNGKVNRSDIHNCTISNIDTNKSVLSRSYLLNSRIYDCDLFEVSIIKSPGIIITKFNTIIFKNFWGSGRYFLYHIPTKLWFVGCFTGNSDLLLAKAKKDNIGKYNYYKKYVNFVEAILENK